MFVLVHVCCNCRFFSSWMGRERLESVHFCAICLRVLCWSLGKQTRTSPMCMIRWMWWSSVTAVQHWSLLTNQSQQLQRMHQETNSCGCLVLQANHTLLQFIVYNSCPSAQQPCYTYRVAALNYFLIPASVSSESASSHLGFGTLFSPQEVRGLQPAHCKHLKNHSSSESFEVIIMATCPSIDMGTHS